MWVTRIILTLGILLGTSYARPDGYGVKGGISHKWPANTVASAHATAQADTGSFGVAKSFASATANVGTNDDATSNADAIANAFLDGGKIGKATTSEKANGNANVPGDSNDLRRTSHDGTNTEYKCINHEDGTAGSDNRNINAKDVASNIGNGNVEQKEKEREPIISHQIHSRPKDSGLADDSQHSQITEDGYGKNDSNSGTTNENNDQSQCATGNSKCLVQQPGTWNLYPPYDKTLDSKPEKSDDVHDDASQKFERFDGSSSPSGNHPGHGNKPESSIDSQRSVGINFGNAGHSSGTTHGLTTGGSQDVNPCVASRDSKCFSQKPGVSNPYPTYEQNSDWSIVPSSPSGIGGGYGGNDKKTETTGGSYVNPCTAGDSKCSGSRPSIPNNRPSYEHVPDSSADSQHSIEINGGHDGIIHRPGTDGGNNSGSNCTPGDSKCSGSRPSISNNRPSYEHVPDSSADSQHSIGINGGHDGMIHRPGTIGGNNSGSNCAPGDSKCSRSRPSISNNHPSYEHVPDSSADSQHSIGINGGHDGMIHRPGTIGGYNSGSNCAPGDSKCSGSRPSISNNRPSYEHVPDISADSQHSIGSNGGHDGMIHRPGTIGGNNSGSNCAPGDSKCSGSRPSISNNHPNYEHVPDLSADSQHSIGINGGYDGMIHRPGTIGGNNYGSNCTPGDSRCTVQKPSTQPSYPTYDKTPATTGSHSKYPMTTDSFSGSNPETSNPFLNGKIDISRLKNLSRSDGTVDNEPNPLNPFLNPHSRVDHPSTGNHRPVDSSGINKDSIHVESQYPSGGSTSGSPNFPQDKPKSVNPFLQQHGHVDSTSDVKYPGVAKVRQGNTGHPVNENHPTSAHLPTSSVHPHETSTRIPDHQDDKPNPANPFLQHGHGAKPTVTPFPEVDNHDNRHSGNHPGYGKTPEKNCNGLSSCPTNKPSGILPEVASTTNSGGKIEHIPGKEVVGSNPFFVNPHSHTSPTKPESYGSLDSKSEAGTTSENSSSGHGTQFPGIQKPESFQGCGSFPSNCNNRKEGKVDQAIESSMNEGHGIYPISGIYTDGVKGHAAGVKGGSHHRRQPVKFESGATATSFANASASAYSNAHASGSTSAAESNAFAKSEAYTDQGNSWSSSSASASASASSSQSQNEWTAPGIPQVPAE